jgi:hypothetical protein
MDSMSRDEIIKASCPNSLEAVIERSEHEKEKELEAQFER